EHAKHRSPGKAHNANAMWIDGRMVGQVFEGAECVREGVAHGRRPAIITAVAAEGRWSRWNTTRRPHVDGERPDSGGIERCDVIGLRSFRRQTRARMSDHNRTDPPSGPARQ